MAKILVLGGIAESLVNFRRHLLKEMVTYNHQVYACAPNASEAIKEKLAEMGVNYQNIDFQRTGINPLRDLVAVQSFIRLFRKIKPDVFLGYTIKPVIYGSIAARIVGVPKIYSMIEGLGYVFTGVGLKRRVIGSVAQYMYKIALKYNQKVFFLNPDDLAQFQRLRLIKNSQQAFLLNGIGTDLEKFAPTSYPANPSFLLIARLVKDKGVCEYIEAARIVKQKYPLIHFNLVGFIDENPSSITEQKLQSWIESGVISYYGFLADVRQAIAESSVYVLPSYREGLPVTVVEAMAMARPIITTNVPGCRETVTNGENGFLVPAKDATALANAMIYFIEQQNDIECMGRASRRIAEEKYDVHKVNAIILSEMDLR